MDGKMKGGVRSNILKLLWHRISEDDLSGLSAQLAYYFILSMFPFLIMLFTLLPYVPIPHQDVMGMIRNFAPAEAMSLIEKNVKDVMNHRNGGLLSFGIIGTIWSASNGINAIVKGFNKAYQVKEGRSFIVTQGTALLLTVGMIFVFILAIVIPVFSHQIGYFLFSIFGFTKEFVQIWNILSYVISAIVLFLVFTFLYWVAPNIKHRIKNALPGAIFATIGWIVSSLGLRFYVGSFGHYSFTYGSIGAIIILLTWLYVSAFILMLGGEINAFYIDETTPKKMT